MPQYAQETSVEQQWRQLDTLFILGMQRSGTSILAIVAEVVAGIRSFGEGHLWLELVEPFARFRHPGYRPALKQDLFALGQDRDRLLRQHLALAVDRFHRECLGPGTERWADKSPGVATVRVAPLLADVFPRAQFVFVYRNPITTVNSALAMWQDGQDLFYNMCGSWAGTMGTWRQVRRLLGDRHLELAQERLASDPRGCAADLMSFLGVPELTDDAARLLAKHRENSAFPDKPPGDYRYDIAFGRRERAFLREVCGPEMELWGYALDFSNPQGPNRRTAPPTLQEMSDMDAYYAWFAGDSVARVHAEVQEVGRLARLAAVTWLVALGRPLLRRLRHRPPARSHRSRG